MTETGPAFVTLTLVDGNVTVNSTVGVVTLHDAIMLGVVLQQLSSRFLQLAFPGMKVLEPH